MRYIKKLALYTKNPVDDRFSVLQDNRIVTNSTSSMQVPTGAKTGRPSTLVDGTIRYNTDLKEFEVYNSQNPGPTPWEILRTIRQATITPQHLGYGNYNDTIFGPLAYTVDVTKPQNILVFVDNVYQVPTTNYTLTRNPTATTASIASIATNGIFTLYLNTLTNIDAGEDGVWRTISAPSGLQVGTTVTNVDFNFNNTYSGYLVGISLPTTGTLNPGTQVSVSYSTGTYVQFTGPVPAKPVFSLLGFDGYFPAGPNGNAFES